MKRILSLLLCVFIVTGVAAQNTAYTLIENVSYRSSGDDYALERCKLDVYYPENIKGFATIVWFHGGGLNSGEKSIPKELKDCGIAVVGVNYRLTPHVKVHDCIEDAAAAVAWVFQEIARYGGDTKKIFVTGHSAGAYLTSMIGLDKKWLAVHGVDADEIVALYPLSGNVISHLAYRGERGMSDTHPLIDEYAPLYHIRKDAPPYIIVTGDRELELAGRYEENAYLWRMMQVIGHPQTLLYELDGYNHGDMCAPSFHIVKNHMKEILK